MQYDFLEWVLVAVVLGGGTVLRLVLVIVCFKLNKGVEKL